MFTVEEHGREGVLQKYLPAEFAGCDLIPSHQPLKILACHARRLRRRGDIPVMLAQLIEKVLFLEYREHLCPGFCER